jgi:predicted HTH transcriptional regulator
LKIKDNMYQIFLNKKTLKEDLTKEVVRISNISREFGIKLNQENRSMTKQEAYTQLGHSASLLRAILFVLYNN